MAITPEQEKPSQIPEGVREVPETPEIPPHIEKGGVKAVPTQVTAQVTDDKGQPLIQTPATKTVSITIPADKTTLSGWAKGEPTSSLTWFANFWLRMIKKALHFGWKIFKRGG